VVSDGGGEVGGPGAGVVVLVGGPGLGVVVSGGEVGSGPGDGAGAASRPQVLHSLSAECLNGA